jgi:hypothetical protein
MGSGEVARYLAANGSAHVSCAAMPTPLLPFPIQTADNAQGIDNRVFEEIMGYSLGGYVAQELILLRRRHVAVLPFWTSYLVQDRSRRQQRETR